MIKYCFIKDELVGKLTINNDGALNMQWKDDKDLSEHARNYKKWSPLKTQSDIEVFIGERVISRAREDCDVWLGMIGLTPNASDLEIFLNNHGVSINNCFWIDDTTSNAFWYNKLKFVMG